MRNRKSVKLLAAALLIGVSLTGCGAKGSETAGSVVATYNGGQVHEGEFQKQYNLQRKLIQPDAPDPSADEKKKFLEEYVLDQKIVYGKAKEAGIKVDPNQVNASFDQYKSQIVQFIYAGDANKFTEQLKKLGLKEQDLKNLVEIYTYLQQYQQEQLKSIQVSDEELKSYYDQNKAGFADATVNHILTKTKEEAEAVKQRLLKGEDFATVAKEVSIDPSAKENGGKMEGSLSQYVPPFRDAAAKLEIGKISDPVQSQFGFHIIKVEKRGEPKPFDQVKEQIRQQLMSGKNEQAWNSHLEELKKSANIQITLPAATK